MRNGQIRQSGRLIQRQAVAALAAGLFFICASAAQAANQMATHTYTFTVITDTAAPQLVSLQPGHNESNIPVHSNIQFTILDDVSGVNLSTLNMSVDGMSIIVNGTVQTYQNAAGQYTQYDVQIYEKSACEHVVVYDPEDYFKYRQVVGVSVSVADNLGNALSNYNYSFRVQNFVASSSKKFSKTTPLAEGFVPLSGAPAGGVVAASRTGKFVYLVWEEPGADNEWDIYCVSSSDFGQTFSDKVMVNRPAAGMDHRKPAVAMDNANNVFVAWQQRQKDGGTWDVYVSRLLNGAANFSDGYPVFTDTQASDQTDIAIAVGPALTSDGNPSTIEPATVYAVWVEANAGRPIIQYTRTTAAYNDSWYRFVSSTRRVDDARAALGCADPSVSLDRNGNIFVAWRQINTDGTSSIYVDRAGKTTTDGGETFRSDAVISSAAAAKRPFINVTQDGSKAFVLWSQLTQGAAQLDFSVLAYNSSSGAISLVKTERVTSTVLAPGQLDEYMLAVDDWNHAFVAWSQEYEGRFAVRFAGAPYASSQFELYADFYEGHAQTRPALAIDRQGNHYYVMWTEGDDIAYCRNAFLETDAITSQNIQNDTGGTVMVSTGDLANLSVSVLPDAIPAPLTVSLARVVGVPDAPPNVTIVGNVVDFGPGGSKFSPQATIQIPYTDAQFQAAGVTDLSLLAIYYYNLVTDRWEIVPGAIIDSGSRIVSVATGHFSIYALGYGVMEGTSRAGSVGGGSGGGGCFIATAAFGTPMASEVRMLSRFRDEHLLRNSWGTEFVKFYYRTSPPIADYLSEREGLKRVVRLALKPLIGLSRMVCK